MMSATPSATSAQERATTRRGGCSAPAVPSTRSATTFAARDDATTTWPRGERRRRPGCGTSEPRCAPPDLRRDVQAVAARTSRRTLGVPPRRRRRGAARALEKERNQQGGARGHRADGSIGRWLGSVPVTCIAGALAASPSLPAVTASGSSSATERSSTAPPARTPRSTPTRSSGSATPGSWSPANQHTGVRDLARAAGAIGPTDDYTIEAAAATTMAQIAGQYTAQEAGATKVKVLIMDGGTWDTILSNGSSASVTTVANTFTQLLSTVAADGTVDRTSSTTSSRTSPAFRGSPIFVPSW